MRGLGAKAASSPRGGAVLALRLIGLRESPRLFWGVSGR